MRYTFVHSPSGHVLRRRLTLPGAILWCPFLKLHRVPPGYWHSVRRSGFGHAVRKGGAVQLIAINSPELMEATHPE